MSAPCAKESRWGAEEEQSKIKTNKTPDGNSNELLMVLKVCCASAWMMEFVCNTVQLVVFSPGKRRSFDPGFD